MKPQWIKPGVCFLLIILLTGCWKEEPAESGQYECTVVEKGSGIPLSGATVEAYKCNTMVWLGNCNDVGPFLTSTTTNAEGKAFFPKSLGIGSILIKKTGYWAQKGSNLSGYEYLLIPVGKIKVTITKSAQQPSNLPIFLEMPIGSCFGCLLEIRPLGQPENFSLYINAAGNSDNVVVYYLGSVSDANRRFSDGVFVNRFDTAQLTIEY